MISMIVSRSYLQVTELQDCGRSGKVNSSWVRRLVDTTGPRKVDKKKGREKVSSTR